MTNKWISSSLVALSFTLLCLGLSMPLGYEPGPHRQVSIAGSDATEATAGTVDGARKRASKITTAPVTSEEASRANVHAPANASLSIRLEPVDSRGTLRIALFNDGQHFPEQERAAFTLSVPATSSSKDHLIHDLPLGSYAVAAYQDLNDDEVLNKGAFGVPTEPYAFSQNARGRYGPPPFVDAKFQLVAPLTRLQITLK